MNPLNYDIKAIALNKAQYPDQYLINAINGGVKSLPPVIAMAAGQMRKQYATAMQGAKAQQELATPKTKDKITAGLQADEAGLAALPAQNMEGMDEAKMLAGGGIVAFADNEDQPVDQNMPGNTPMTTKQMNDLLYGRGIARTPEQIEKAKKESSAFFMSPRTRAAMAATTPTPTAGPDVDAQAGGLYGGKAPTQQQFLTAHPNITNADVGIAAAAPAIKQTGVGGSPGQAPGAQPGQPQNSGILAAYNEFMNRPDPFAGLGDTDAQHAAKIKKAEDQGLGSFLMAMGAKVMRHVGPLGAAGGEGVEAGLPHLEASQKVVRDLDSARDQFKFNEAKAKELRAQGKIEAAIKYEQANTDLMYKTGQLAVEHEKNAMLKPYYGAMAGFYGSGKGKNPNELTLDQAAKDFATAIKDPGMKRQLAALGVTDALKFRQYMNTGVAPLTVTGTIPQGAPTLQLNQG